MTGRLITALLAIAGCAPAQTATPWREAERIFHSDPQWLGSDGAFSIDLGNGRVLWSFGDTLVARKPGDGRKNAAFVRNTVAIMTGYDPVTAQMKFYWRKGSRMEIFPSEGNIWMWPAHGIRISEKLIVFCGRIARNPDKNSFGFQGVGTSVFLIENPDAEPTVWKMRDVFVETTQIMLGTAVIRDGDFLYVYCEAEPSHDIYLGRIGIADAVAGKFASMNWWDGSAFGNRENRKPVMHDVSSEISVQRDPRGGFIEVNSQGFGGSDIVMRRAAKLEGPWSAPVKIYRPPESDWKDPFVYAGKAHPELKGTGLAITYAVNGKEDEVAKNPSLYYPKFAKMDWVDR